MKLLMIQMTLMALLCIASSSSTLLKWKELLKRKLSLFDLSCPPKYLKPLPSVNMTEISGPWWVIKCLPGPLCDDLYCFSVHVESSPEKGYTALRSAYNKSADDIWQSSVGLKLESGAVVAASPDGPTVRFIPLGIGKTWMIFTSCILGKLGVFIYSREHYLLPAAETEVLEVLKKNSLESKKFRMTMDPLCPMLDNIVDAV